MKQNNPPDSTTVWMTPESTCKPLACEASEMEVGGLLPEYANNSPRLLKTNKSVQETAISSVSVSVVVPNAG